MLQVSETLESIKGTLGLSSQPERPPTFWEEISNYCQLSWTMRIVCFIGFLVVGLFFVGLSTVVIFSPTSFAKFYTFGSIFIFASSFFLVGPARQAKSIFSDKGRIIAVSVYVCSIVLTLYCALKWVSVTTLMVVVQFVAAIWYGASYIPFAQSCLYSTAKSILPL